MVELYPTPTRLRLLQDVDDGAVHQPFPYTGAHEFVLDHGPGENPRYRRVHSRYPGDDCRRLGACRRPGPRTTARVSGRVDRRRSAGAGRCAVSRVMIRTVLDAVGFALGHVLGPVLRPWLRWMTRKERVS